MATRHVTIRLEKEIIEKLRLISNEKGCTVNEQMNIYVSELVSEFEKKHGEIKVEKRE